MEAKNYSTLHFAEKTGDKLFIEIEITGNPDEVVSKIFYSLNKHTDLFEGAKCSQVLFKGRCVDDIIKEASNKALQSIKDAFTGIEEEMKF